MNKSILVNLPSWGHDSGLFVYLEFMINSIIYSLENKYNYLPIPDFEYSYNKYLHDGIFFDNFFELSYDYKSYINNESILKEKMKKDFWKEFHHNYGIFCYPHSKGLTANLYLKYNTFYTEEINNWYFENRKKANEILNKYIKINDNIINKTNKIYNNLFDKNDYIIGCHIRGTDKKIQVGGEKIEPTMYYKYIDKLLLKHPNAKIFLATDDQNYFKLFINKYKDKVKYVENVLRSDKNVFLDTSIKNNYKKGEDVLIDCLLLSKCNFLLKCSSAVSEFAVYFNLNLHYNCINLQYDCSKLL